MKKIMQFRFRGEGHEENYPDLEFYKDELTLGNIFQDYGLISKLGIQGPVGTRFYLNNSPYPIMIGETGIYELDLENIGRISAIKFSREDINNFYTEEVQQDKILIDIVYEGVR